MLLRTYECSSALRLQIVELKQELLSIPPLISSLVEGRGNQHINRYYELSKRIDGHFEDIFDQLSYISMFRC